MRPLLILLLLACAPARKPFGELSVSAEHELLPQGGVVHEAVFRIETGRIVAAGAHSGARLDLAAIEDGCLRGESYGKYLYICPAPAEPGDPKGIYRFRSVSRDIVAFSVQLQDYGDSLRVVTNRSAAELPLPPGPAGDEMRRHPELLGAAFALGLLPASSDSRDLWTYRVLPR